MKKSLIAAVVLASASFASTAAMAATVGNTPQVLDLTDGSGFFGDTFAMNNTGNTFSDRFTFTVPSAGATSLDASVWSVSRTADTGLDITGLSLYNATGDTLVRSGTSLLSGNVDLWAINADSLAAGNYYLQVNGNVVSDQPASFGGTVTLAAPVPEPETYGMMLAGLGVLGYLARRRKTSQQA
jgi:hypothetical protein